MELLKIIPDLRTDIHKKSFKKPMSKGEKQYCLIFLALFLASLAFIGFRLLTHTMFASRIARLETSIASIKHKIFLSQNELNEVSTLKQFSTFLEEWRKNYTPYYTQLVKVFASFPEEIPAQEFLFSEEKVVIKLGQITSQKVAKPLKHFYTNIAEKCPNLSFSEKTINNRISLCAIKKKD